MYKSIYISNFILVYPLNFNSYFNLHFSDIQITELTDELQVLKNKLRLEQAVRIRDDAAADSMHRESLVEALKLVNTLENSLRDEILSKEKLNVEYTGKISEANQTISLLEAGLLTLQTTLDRERNSLVSAKETISAAVTAELYDLYESFDAQTKEVI